MHKTFHFAYWTKSPALPAPCLTSPFLKQWRARHRLTCGFGEIANAFHGLDFGSIIAHVYTDLECSRCHEHYVELLPANRAEEG